MNKYVLIKGIPEHRIVVEKFIKRKLKLKEEIHHINGIKSDNKISNLMLFPTKKEHIAFHRKIQQFGFTNPIQKQIRERWKNLK